MTAAVCGRTTRVSVEGPAAAQPGSLGIRPAWRESARRLGLVEVDVDAVDPEPRDFTDYAHDTAATGGVPHHGDGVGTYADRRRSTRFRSELAVRAWARERVSRSADVRKRSRNMARSGRSVAETETKVPVRADIRTPPTSVSPCQSRGGCGIRTREGLHPTRFPSERHRPLGESSARNLTGSGRFD